MASKADRSEWLKRMCLTCFEKTLFKELKAALVCQKCGYKEHDQFAILLHRELLIKPPKTLFLSLLNGFCGKFRFGNPVYTEVKVCKVDGIRKFWIGVTLKKLGLSVLGEGKPKAKDSKRSAAQKLLTTITKICQAGGPLTGVSPEKLADCLEWIEKS